MDRSTFINALFLCLFNVIFMIAGIFLNSVVIISLRRSSQLRKKVCYFMILPLSCFDVAVVAFNHPIIVFRTILLSMDTYNSEESKLMTAWKAIVGNLTGFSISALVILSVERFLALKYPFFHQTAVTKKTLSLSLGFFVFITVSLSSSLFFDGSIFGKIVIGFVSLFLLLFIYLNYNIFIIAKSKRKGNTTYTPNDREETKGRALNLKQISTCSMAVGCFLICFFPRILFSVLHLTSDVLSYNRPSLVFRIWSSTFLTMNSTFNCLIFFWKNSVLRREGMKTVKYFWPRPRP